MRKSEIVELMARVAASWPNWHAPTGSDATAWLIEWHAMLGDLDAAVVTAALRAYSAEGHEWPPALGVIRQRAVAAMSPRQPDPDEAWGEVRRAFASHGYVRVPEWSSDAVAEAVRNMGGWRHLCETCTADSEVADRAHFRQFYAAAAARLAPNATPPADRLVLEGLRGGLAAIGHVSELEAGDG